MRLLILFYGLKHSLLQFHIYLFAIDDKFAMFYYFVLFLLVLTIYHAFGSLLLVNFYSVFLMVTTFMMAFFNIIQFWIRIVTLETVFFELKLIGIFKFWEWFEPF